MTHRIKSLLIGTLLVLLSALITFWFASTSKMKEHWKIAESHLMVKYREAQKINENLPDIDFKFDRSISSLLTPWNPAVRLSLDLAGTKPSKDSKPVSDQEGIALLSRMGHLSKEKTEKLVEYLHSLGAVDFSTTIALDELTARFKRTLQLPNAHLDALVDAQATIEFNDGVFKKGDQIDVLARLTGFGVDVHAKVVFNDERAEAFLDKQLSKAPEEKKKQMKEKLDAFLKVEKSLVGEYEFQSGISDGEIGKLILGWFMVDTHTTTTTIEGRGDEDETRHIDVSESRPNIKPSDVLGDIQFRVKVNNDLIKDAAFTVQVNDIKLIGAYKDIDIIFEMERTFENDQKLRETVKKAASFSPQAAYFDKLLEGEMKLDHQSPFVEIFSVFASELSEEIKRHPKEVSFPHKVNLETKINDGVFPVLPYFVMSSSGGNAVMVNESVSIKDVPRTEDARSARDVRKDDKKDTSKYAPMRDSGVKIDSDAKKEARRTPLTAGDMAESVSRSVDAFTGIVRMIIPQSLNITLKTEFGENSSEHGLNVVYDPIRQKMNVTFDGHADSSAEFNQMYVKSLLSALNRINRMIVEKSGVDWDQTLPDSLMKAVQELESSSSEFQLELTGIDFYELIQETNSFRNVIEHLKFTTQSSIGDSESDFELMLDGIARNAIYHGEIKFDDKTDDVGAPKTISLALSREMIKSMILMASDFQGLIIVESFKESFQPGEREQLEKMYLDKLKKEIQEKKKRMSGLDTVFKTLDDNDLSLNLNGSFDGLSLYNEPSGFTFAALDGELKIGAIDAKVNMGVENRSSFTVDFDLSTTQEALDLADGFFMMSPMKGLDPQLKSQLLASYDKKPLHLNGKLSVDSILGFGFPETNINMTGKFGGVTYDITTEGFRETPQIYTTGSKDEISQQIMAQDYFFHECKASYADYKKVMAPEFTKAIKKAPTGEARFVFDGLNTEEFLQKREIACHASHSVSSYGVPGVLTNVEDGRRCTPYFEFERSPILSNNLPGGITALHASVTTDNRYDISYKDCPVLQKVNKTAAITRTSQALPPDADPIKYYLAVDDAQFWSKHFLPGQGCRDFKKPNNHDSWKPYQDMPNVGDKMSSSSYSCSGGSIFMNQSTNAEERNILKNWESESGIIVEADFGIRKMDCTNDTIKYYYVSPAGEALEDFNLKQCSHAQDWFATWLSKFETKDKKALSLYGKRSQYYTEKELRELYTPCMKVATQCWKEKNNYTPKAKPADVKKPEEKDGAEPNPSPEASVQGDLPQLSYQGLTVIPIRDRS